MFSFFTTGVCAKQIIFSIEDGIIDKVSFNGGCSGNLIGVSRLVEGMKVEEAINKLQGIKCGSRNTSCPDQLATALQISLKKQAG
ncbi:TIGR03905 family TSCPD domain-containing protein [Serpentinicella alkaliphila]|uniref:ribonucleoside-diphosphate reductase n=1 Tax=Serpentinicella alkaliphila TaxID=1734049 RepID=A0A4R2TL91_9FIRM|nr:TIGR03905 family TSCPD domain-containing protein [Serpentinicella alkaliphila]QUH25890.1 TIGR03905 family TSCPD domain-containing protein [Serpentinicella alkaliphila]TCQ01955.1 uncharacterized protein (TIGR03905 family) [Serpentinicella alkaliphila]